MLDTTGSLPMELQKETHAAFAAFRNAKSRLIRDTGTRLLPRERPQVAEIATEDPGAEVLHGVLLVPASRSLEV